MKKKQKNSSKQHETIVLRSIFDDSKKIFDDLGYTDYTFENRKQGHDIPDGYFSKDNSVIWIEHTEANLNYNHKHSELPGYKGFCNNMKQKLINEVKEGYLYFELSSSLAKNYFESAEIKEKMVNTAKEAISSKKEIFNTELKFFVKYCPPKPNRQEEEKKPFTVKISTLENIDFCETIPIKLYDKCVKVKEEIYKKNKKQRTENWLFIEEPWGYQFKIDLTLCSDYFDKIFIVEQDFIDGKECYIPELIATKCPPFLNASTNSVAS